MKRIFAVVLATVLLGSVAGAALADDEAPESEDTETTKELSDAQMWKAKMIADYFVDDTGDEAAVEAAAEALTGDILEVRTGDPAVGWGALYKLMLLSKANGMTLTDYLATMDGDGGWAFGKRFKELDGEQKALLADTPKNLGQANKQAKAEERAERKAHKKSDD